MILIIATWITFIFLMFVQKKLERICNKKSDTINILFSEIEPLMEKDSDLCARLYTKIKKIEKDYEK